MKPVFLEAHLRCRLQPGQRLAFQHPLLRRMTSLQQASFEALEQLRQNHAPLLDEWLHDEACDIFFTTTYGELRSVYKVAQQINHHELPVSPLHFQHSVHNATAGYLAIVARLTKNITTFGSGYLALDRAFYWIYQNMAQAHTTRAILIHSDESLFAHEPCSAQADVFVFSSADTSQWPRPYQLLDVSVCVEQAAAEKLAVDQTRAEAFMVFEEPVTSLHQRSVASSAGERIDSTWRRL